MSDNKLKREDFDVILPTPSGGGDGGDGPPPPKIKDWQFIDPPKPEDSEGKGEGEGEGEGEDSEGKGEGKGKGEGEKREVIIVKINPINSGVGGIITHEDSVKMQEELGVPYEEKTLSEEEIKDLINRGIVEGTIPDENHGGKGPHGTGKSESLRRALAKRSKPQVDWKKELKKFIDAA